MTGKAGKTHQSRQAKVQPAKVFSEKGSKVLPQRNLQQSGDKRRKRAAL